MVNEKEEPEKSYNICTGLRFFTKKDNDRENDRNNTVKGVKYGCTDKHGRLFNCP